MGNNRTEIIDFIITCCQCDCQAQIQSVRQKAEKLFCFIPRYSESSYLKRRFSSPLRIFFICSKVSEGLSLYLPENSPT